MPIFFIWPLNLPVIERVLITVLMGFGITAATAGAMKLYYIGTWKFGEEGLNDWVSMFMWVRVEEICLIVSACAPFLKRPIEDILSRFGPLKHRFVTISLKSFRSGGRRSRAMDIPKGESPTKQQLTQNSGEAVSVSLVSSDHGSDGAKDKRRGMDHAEGA